MVKRILYADDDDLFRKVVLRLLTGLGYHAEAVEDGAQALLRAQDAIFDALVLDSHMPGLTGIEVATRLRALEITTPVLLISAETDVSSLARLAGTPHYLAKPFAREDLKQSLVSMGL